MKNLAIYLLTALFLSSYAGRSKKDEAIDPIVFYYSERIKCDVYKVYYTQDLKVKTKKANLETLAKLGFNTNLVILMSVN